MTSGSDGSEAPIEPDTKDWTWVLVEPCPDCAFDAAGLSHTDVARYLRRDADDWVIRLSGASVTRRRTPGVWSVLEYGCHVRDVHRVFADRVRLVLDEDAPRFRELTPFKDPLRIQVTLAPSPDRVNDICRTVPRADDHGGEGCSLPDRVEQRVDRNQPRQSRVGPRGRSVPWAIALQHTGFGRRSPSPRDRRTDGMDHRASARRSAERNIRRRNGFRRIER